MVLTPCIHLMELFKKKNEKWKDSLAVIPAFLDILKKKLSPSWPAVKLGKVALVQHHRPVMYVWCYLNLRSVNLSLFDDLTKCQVWKTLNLPSVHWFSSVRTSTPGRATPDRESGRSHGWSTPVSSVWEISSGIWPPSERFNANNGSMSKCNFQNYIFFK